MMGFKGGFLILITENGGEFFQGCGILRLFPLVRAVIYAVPTGLVVFGDVFQGNWQIRVFTCLY